MSEPTSCPVNRSFARPVDDARGAEDNVDPWRVAARWWEPMRAPYNLVLVLVFLLLAARTWDRFAPELSVGNVLRLGVLALIANLCYSTAYAADMALRTVPALSRRSWWRLSLWAVGTLAAVLLEAYWFLDEILPPLSGPKP